MRWYLPKMVVTPTVPCCTAFTLRNSSSTTSAAPMMMPMMVPLMKTSRVVGLVGRAGPSVCQHLRVHAVHVERRHSSPNEVPSSRPASSVSQSSGTVRSRPMASAMLTYSTCGSFERHHHTVHPLVERAHGGGAEAAAQQAVGGSGGAAAHQVAEHHGASLLARETGEFVGHRMTDAAESLGVIGGLVDDLAVAVQRRRALGDDDDGVVRCLRPRGGEWQRRPTRT